MGVTEHKAVKIKLNNKTASGMYILLIPFPIKNQRVRTEIAISHVWH